MTRLKTLRGRASAMVMFCFFVACASAAEFDWDFESEPAGWVGQGCSIERTDAAAKWGRWSLAVSRRFPGVATIHRAISLDVAERPVLRYHVLAPQSAGPTLKTLVYLKNKDGLWYQCERALPLYPGGWSEVAFDLSPSSTHGGRSRPNASTSSGKYRVSGLVERDPISTSSPSRKMIALKPSHFGS